MAAGHTFHVAIVSGGRGVDGETTEAPDKTIQYMGGEGSGKVLTADPAQRYLSYFHYLRNAGIVLSHPSVVSQ
jgi:hypothetical protein